MKPRKTTTAAATAATPAPVVATIPQPVATPAPVAESRVYEFADDDLIIVVAGGLKHAKHVGIDTTKTDGVLVIPERGVDKHGEYEGETGWTCVEGENDKGKKTLGISLGAPFKRKANYGDFACSGWFTGPPTSQPSAKTSYKRVAL